MFVQNFDARQPGLVALRYLGPIAAGQRQPLEIDLHMARLLRFRQWKSLRNLIAAFRAVSVETMALHRKNRFQFLPSPLTRTVKPIGKSVLCQ